MPLPPTRPPPDAPESASFATESLDEALQAGLGWLSAATPEDAAYRYGGEAGSSTEALIWVGPLDSIDAYASVVAFLESVPGVGTVYPKEADGRGTAFTVIPRGALPAIASAAASREWLRRTSPPSYPTSGVGGERASANAGRWDAGEDPRFGDGAARDAGAPDARPARRSSEPAVAAYRPLAPNAELAFEYLR